VADLYVSDGCGSVIFTAVLWGRKDSIWAEQWQVSGWWVWKISQTFLCCI